MLRESIRAVSPPTSTIIDTLLASHNPRCVGWQRSSSHPAICFAQALYCSLEDGRLASTFCEGCFSEFRFRVLEVDHIISCGSGSQDNIENLQLLFAHCNRVKGNRPQEYLVAKLRELGIAV